MNIEQSIVKKEDTTEEDLLSNNPMEQDPLEDVENLVKKEKIEDEQIEVKEEQIVIKEGHIIVKEEHIIVKEEYIIVIEEQKEDDCDLENNILDDFII